MGLEVNVTSDSWVLAGAKNFGNFWVGFGFGRTDIAFDITGHQRTDGILSMASIKKAFNDPQTPWETSYYSQANGKLTGTSWSKRFGVTYSPGKKFLFGTYVRFQDRFDMEGPLDFKLYTFPALKLNAEEGEKKFDVNLIAADELTKTKSKEYITPSSISTEIPSAVSIAATFLGPLSPSLNYTKYFGEISYEMTMHEDGAEFFYKRGIKPDWSFLLGLDFKALQISLGATELVELVEGYRDASGIPLEPSEPVIVPRFSLGFNTRITNNVTIGTMLFGLPEDALRFSLIYEF